MIYMVKGDTLREGVSCLNDSGIALWPGELTKGVLWKGVVLGAEYDRYL